jgi:hypothetical protein
MPRSKTRAIDRPRPKDLWGSKAFRARVQRLLYAKLKAGDAEDAERQRAKDVAQEKAPDLATGGSVNVVILGKDPGPQETQALAAVPDRRATRLSGMTAFTD